MGSLSDLFVKPFDFKKIKEKSRKFVFIHSDNDPYCPLEHVRFLHEKLGGELIIQPGQKHFSISTFGEKYNQFPFLLALIKHSGYVGLIRDFVSHYQLMAVATYGEHPWIANVYFAVDEDLTLYFLSAESRLHSQHIAQNKEVAASIFDSTFTPRFQKKFSKKGIQIFGEAEKLVNEKDVTYALEEWKLALDITGDYFSYQKIKDNQIDGRMYKITPKKIKMFNDQLFDEEEVPILELK